MAAIGIDFGSSYCCVGVCRNGKVEIVSDEHGSKTVPSYVAFTNTEILTGKMAKLQSPYNPVNTVFGSKKLLGRRYDDDKDQSHLRHLPFHIHNEEGKPVILVEYKEKKRTFTPEEVSAKLLSRMKELAEAYLSSPVKNVVFSIPTYFNESQQRALMVAGNIAGLNVIGLIHEPTAVAVAYVYERGITGVKHILVYDLGGSTFDVSVICICGGSHFTVTTTKGCTNLGGQDFDARLAGYFANDFRKTFNIDLLSNPEAMIRLKMAAEKTKILLSSLPETTITVESLYNGIDYRGKVTRAIFEELCSNDFRNTMLLVTEAMNEAQLTKEDIDDIILIGGSTLIPKIKTMISEFFNRRPMITSSNPDESMAFGAATQAMILTANRHINIQELLPLNVVPLTLGIGVDSGLIYPMIKRNTEIPCSETRIITTLYDYQNFVSVEIYEGERPLAKYNKLLGILYLDGIPSAPRGGVMVEITFNIDADGILTASIKHQDTGNSKAIVIENSSRLSGDEVERVIAEANSLKESDDDDKRAAEAKIRLEAYIHQVKQKIQENGDKLSNEDKIVMSEEIEEAVNWLEGREVYNEEECERKRTELQKRWSKIIKPLYDYIQINTYDGKRKRNVQNICWECSRFAKQIVNKFNPKYWKQY